MNTEKHDWESIEDLPHDYGRLADTEMKSLVNIWEEQRSELEDTQALKDFNVKLLRQTAIETGIIERVYTLDRGITQLLIERGLDAALIPKDSTDKNPELVIEIIRDQYKATEGLFDFVSSKRHLSTSYIKELHSLLTAHQRTAEAVDQFGKRFEVELVKGDYKKLPNNPTRPDGSVHIYCPPEQVANEMEKLVRLHQEHINNGISSEIEAAWFHHRFTQIHPFQDGNGRVARALSTLIFLKAGWFPLAITNGNREVYIDALEAADNGDLTALVRLFVRIERKAFVSALAVARDVLQSGKSVDYIVEAIRDSIQKRREALRQEWEQSKSVANLLRHCAYDRLSQIAKVLKDQLSTLSPPGKKYTFFVKDAENDSKCRDWFRYQIIETARRLEYYANPYIFHSWCRLVLRTDVQAEFLISFHGIGHEYRGLLVASATFFKREVVEEKERAIQDVAPITDELFQINYKEPQTEIKPRFEKWLDEVIVTGLETWRQSVSIA